MHMIKVTIIYYSRLAYKVDVILLLLDEPILKRKRYQLKTFNPFHEFFMSMSSILRVYSTCFKIIIRQLSNQLASSRYWDLLCVNRASGDER